ncbi:MAG TPA: hypothetical protein VGM56_27300 [Byssovorax sp.]|jgi:hypothetical protein
MSGGDDGARRPPRRLPLMPELLPAPPVARLARVDPDPRQRSRVDPTPRERTLDHMRRLLALAATAAALGGCGEEQQLVVAAPPVVDPVPVPARHYPLAIRTIAKVAAVKGAKGLFELTLSRPAVLDVSWSTDPPKADRLEILDVHPDGDGLVVRFRFEHPGDGGSLRFVALTPDGERGVSVDIDDRPPPPIDVKVRDLQ